MEENIYPHLKRLPRAKPPEDLFEKIEAAIKDTKVVVMADWRRFAAAAVIIATLNVAALVQYAQSQPETSPGVATVETPLVSDYEIY